jgi:hypothetical protein
VRASDLGLTKLGGDLFRFTPAQYLVGREILGVKLFYIQWALVISHVTIGDKCVACFACKGNE